MIETALIETAKQVPSLVLLVVVVYMFLQQQKATAAMQRKYIDDRDKAMERVGDQCHEVQRDSVKVIRDCVQALGATTELLREVKRLLVEQRGGTNK